MAPGMTTMLLSFPVLMLAQKIDFENPDNVMYARLAFLTIQLLCFVTAKYLQGVRYPLFHYVSHV